MLSTLWFVGVSTGHSLIHEAFPLWMADLGLDLRLVGRDLPLTAPVEAYRSLMSELIADDGVVGAVITSHKVTLLHAAGDLVDQLDPLAAECGEINAVRREQGRLTGFARDPISVGRVVDEIWPDGTNLLCLGSGGTAIALGSHMLTRTVPPERLVFTDPRPDAGRHLRSVLGPRATARRVRLEVHHGDGTWDHLVRDAPAGTLVINATGLGKDRPGSPLSPAPSFPPGVVVWDLNYRGDLALLRQAAAAGVTTYDGWRLFCHGWAAALGPILGLADEANRAERFATLAAPLRGPA
ncbi:shikimate 5-dehydrogenase [Micromonospora pisi]|uniref:Shikimate 5-dehydrogenase n=1 Tax=Micromonospora pisi TaxID=589240 RepID=A0A495JBH4_9ACTN|nr:shikimate dehydrogenase [Micromonospora pisi]RKR85858.1 shikimate 5-dehydrogenase [Micromonospora pisi]